MQPGPFLQKHPGRGRQADMEESSDGSQDRAKKKNEPQELVRTRISTIEEQIQELMAKKLELQGVAKLVSQGFLVPAGSSTPDDEAMGAAPASKDETKMPPGLQPAIAGRGMRLPLPKA